MRSAQGYTVFPGISARALIGRRTLNQGEHLLRFPLKKLENDLVVPGKFIAFTKSAAIGKKIKRRVNVFLYIIFVVLAQYLGEGAYLKKNGIPKPE